MTKFGYKLSTSVAAMMLSLTAAQAQNALAQSRQHGHGHGNDPGGQSSGAVDPGVRGGPAGAGGPIQGLTAAQMAFFTAAQARFEQVETVSSGLGPGFNELVCSNCHIQPAVGGASPTTNPQVTDANTDGATNVIPSFITTNGPIREARFISNPDGTPDGSVHNLFSIQGRSDAPGCVFAQPNFAAELANNNVIFRIPINTFGDGLVEGLPDLSLQNTFNAQAQQNASLGISGTFNRSGNTGNITRFGWKAQNSSMLMFAGEAYNVEEGVTNQLFPDKRNFTAPATTTASPQCAPNPLPEDTVNTVDTINSGSTVSDNNPDIINFALFMSLLAPPTPAIPFTTSSTASTTASTSTPTTASTTASSTASSTASTTSGSNTVAMASVLPTAAGSSTPSTSSATTSSTTSTASAASITAGFQAFTNVGCSGCHIVTQTTTNLDLIDTTTNPNISNTTINTFSDYAVHNMGQGLADQVTQGNANGTQFRSAPLWGVGQRVFFLHDGRTNNLLTAIEDHASSGSEANQVIAQFNMLSTTDQQNILNFLRDL
jgi:CxxC motif-containing protein (DUF1111 family)